MMSKKLGTAALCLVVLLAGCASTPEPTPALREAQQAYQRAKSNPDVLRYAADQIGEAERTLRRADTAETLVDMNSLAYVANAQVQTAEAVARRTVAEARIEELAQVRDRVMLENREAELASARPELAALQAKETAGNGRDSRQRVVRHGKSRIIAWRAEGRGPAGQIPGG